MRHQIPPAKFHSLASGLHVSKILPEDTERTTLCVQHVLKVLRAVLICIYLGVNQRHINFFTFPDRHVVHVAEDCGIQV